MRWAWLGRIAYGPAVALQEALRRAILEDRAEETLLLLEHEPVITLGKSAQASNVLLSPEELARRGIAVAPSSRGGDVTYHGPGQLVGYPIFRVQGALAHVELMSSALCQALAPQGVRPKFRRERPGLWVDERKIAAYGVHIHRRVAMHGFALNINRTPLDAFSAIVPCGLATTVVTSAENEGAPSRPVSAWASDVAVEFAACRGEVARRVDAAEVLP